MEINNNNKGEYNKMGSSLINGFSDIIAAPNLTSNGSFKHNQRGNFTSFTGVVINDFVSDCWKVTSHNISLCECYNFTGNGELRLRGYGSKGQYIVIENIDITTFAQPAGQGALTSSMNIFNISGVPVKVSCNPKYHTAYLINVFDSEPIVARESKGVPVSAKRTFVDNFTNTASITCTLQADGDFEFVLYNFKEIAGLYRNPTIFSFVNYADDLARVERYYQVGETSGSVYVPFRTKMAGTPTVTLTSGTASNITANGFVSSGTGVHSWTASI